MRNIILLFLLVGERLLGCLGHVPKNRYFLLLRRRMVGRRNLAFEK